MNPTTVVLDLVSIRGNGASLTPADIDYALRGAAVSDIIAHAKQLMENRRAYFAKNMAMMTDNTVVAFTKVSGSILGVIRELELVHHHAQ